MKTSRKQFGFTLIELLVVISIIALLLSILMPGLSKAKRQAQVVVCAANMHNISVAANTFKASYGKLAVPYHLSGSQFKDAGHCYPFWVQGDENMMSNGDWKKYGTPMKTWIDMGASMDVWICPGQKWLGYANWSGNHNQIIPIDHPFCGKMYRTTIAYLAGVDLEKNSYNTLFKDKQPSVRFITKTDDRNPSGKVMGGDMVALNGTALGQGWYYTNVDQYYINHTVKWGKPTAQNLLYGDGSVKNTGAGPWQANPLNGKTWTYALPYMAFPYFYFGGTDWYSASTR